MKQQETSKRQTSKHPCNASQSLSLEKKCPTKSPLNPSTATLSSCCPPARLFFARNIPFLSLITPNTFKAFGLKSTLDSSKITKLNRIKRRSYKIKRTIFGVLPVCCSLLAQKRPRPRLLSISRSYRLSLIELCWLF
jgi:hypothetical protein